MTKKTKHQKQNSLQQTSSQNQPQFNPAQPNHIGVSSYTQHFSGPLPHSDILAGYDQVVPGAANRILQKFEDQTAHRIEIEKLVVKSGTQKERLGLWFGFIIAMTTIVGGILTALFGKAFLGGSLSFAGLALLVGAFLFSRSKPQGQPD